MIVTPLAFLIDKDAMTIVPPLPVWLIVTDAAPDSRLDLAEDEAKLLS